MSCTYHVLYDYYAGADPVLVERFTTLDAAQAAVMQAERPDDAEIRERPGTAVWRRSRDTGYSITIEPTLVYIS